ncbi:hypothetical protein [Cupriavidus sp. USMAHM13]|uniref:hypothetical protein n=1 Tax=Cupriavidus sp. USMAHM13 TaxID=1389192 RepID=UPI0012EA7846|nr:hypothetical protein [Cupriavidus sp. USMAHM13]
MHAVEKMLVKALCPDLERLGFSWINAREMFVRRWDGGFDSFTWAAHPTHDDGGRLELIPLVGVRHDVVDDVVNQLGLVFGAGNQMFTTTVERGLGYFPFSPSRNYVQYIRFAAAEGDVLRVSANMLAILKGEGGDFYEKYSSLLNCSVGLNEPVETKVHPLCNNFPRRAYYGIACSAIAESDRLKSLVDQYKSYVAKIAPAQRERVEKRIDDLISLLEGGRFQVRSATPLSY